MRIDYDVIGQLAEQIGCRRIDLIALSPQNDPFYTGVRARREAAEWFARLWRELGFKPGSHTRRIHYVLVSQKPPILKPNGEPYLNTENDWKYLGSASLGARYDRLIPDGALSDHRNDPAMIFAAAPTPTRAAACEMHGAQLSLLNTHISREVLAPWLKPVSACVPQPFLVEVWVEKSTQNDVLIPLARRLGFNLQTGAGETSEILARDAITRAIEDRRPMRILYVSDFDPGGRSMPVALARKIQYWISELELDLDITLDPVVLTPEQCEHYGLPRIPLKDERRAAKFEERFGAGATELDALEALHPGELAKIVEAEVCRYIDPALGPALRATNSAFERRIRAVESSVLSQFDTSDIEDRFNELVEQFESDIEDLQYEADGMWEEIAARLSAEAPQFDSDDLPEPRDATPPDEPLYDSERSYLDQMDYYHNWQGRGA